MGSWLTVPGTNRTFSEQMAPNGTTLTPGVLGRVPTADGPATIALPPNPADGQSQAVIDADGEASSNPITIDGAGKTIDGEAEIVVTSDGAELVFQFDRVRDEWRRVIPAHLFDAAQSYATSYVVGARADAPDKGEIALVSGLVNASTTLVRCGARVVDPSALKPVPKRFRFFATLENSAHSALWSAEVRLLDLTADPPELITGSVLTNASAPDKSIATQVSALLDVGAAAGRIKPTPTMLAVQLVIAGSAGIEDRAILSNARLLPEF